MKKINLLIIFVFVTLSGFSQTTATNFNCNDCSANNHDFFTELNQGKIIVLAWVMPCSSCLGPSKTAYNIVQSYATSNPGKVFMYICDDYDNTNCTSLSSWVDNNGMPNAVKFSNSSIKMSDYGSEGMPKIIVVGGKNHTVYFNEINSAAGNSTKIQAAVNSAITASIEKEKQLLSLSSIEISPNPAINNPTVSLTLKNSLEITIELFNSVGQKVMTVIEKEKLSQGENDIEIPTLSIANGIYYVKVSEASGSKIIKMVVAH